MSDIKIYPNDSEKSIIIKKDRQEVADWGLHLESINEMLAALMSFLKKQPNSASLKEQIVSIRRDNTLLLTKIYTYSNALQKSMECDTVSCDNFYHYLHEKNRKIYRGHVQQVRSIKNELYNRYIRK
ncbi:hypothetical protein [Galbibacter sp. PAP.153]|uniref:hypothetical protein n=1 Tax=Galbibacter sp. PAP.153 TaxID=3104623 RepID=UPI00300B6801